MTKDTLRSMTHVGLVKMTLITKFDDRGNIVSTFKPHLHSVYTWSWDDEPGVNETITTFTGKDITGFMDKHIEIAERMVS